MRESEGKLEKGLLFENCENICEFCERVSKINGHLDNPNEENSGNTNNTNSLENGIKVVVTIPAYNEEEKIGEVIKNIKSVMDETKHCYNYLILVVNDGSTDKTVDEAIKAGAFVYSHEINQGLAETFRTEMKLCSELGTEIIVHTDADGQYRAEEIPNLIEQVELGYDLVLGSRFMGTIESMPKMKRFGNKAFSRLISLLTRRRISDGQTGFRAFTRKVAEELPIESDYTYTQEQIIRACQNNYKILEVPAYFAKRDNGPSRLMKNPLDYAIRAWRNIIKLYFVKK
ncbi:MAG: glycosyltransferase family 2 protein [Candidatus Heimdallarchaeota archaeon]